MTKAAGRLNDFGILLTTTILLSTIPVIARDHYLTEQTRLRVSVFQLSPQTGLYDRWDALSGELTVGAGGIVNVPIIGAMALDDMSLDQVSEAIAQRLQSQLGLLAPPDVMTEIIAYPPIYVVGTVAQPGEYAFRPNMTVLQALALGGGQLRSDDASAGASDRIRLLAEAKTIDNSIVQTALRVARLQADLDGSGAIASPMDTAPRSLAQEQALLDAGRTARDRQIASLNDLQTLYQQEIAVLDVRIADLDRSIATTESELAGVEQLVESGIATIARRSELERLLASMRSDRLDQRTAIMRAKQFMTEAERNADGIEDSRRAELTGNLLIEQASLEQSQLDRQTTQTLLAELDRQLLGSNGALGTQTQNMDFRIVRNLNGVIGEIEVSEATTLLPGDVVKVSVGGQAAPALALAPD